MFVNGTSIHRPPTAGSRVRSVTVTVTNTDTQSGLLKITVPTHNAKSNPGLPVARKITGLIQGLLWRGGHDGDP